MLRLSLILPLLLFFSCVQAQVSGPTTHTPKLTVTPGATDVQNLTVHGTCTGCGSSPIIPLVGNHLIGTTGNFKVNVQWLDGLQHNFNFYCVWETGTAFGSVLAFGLVDSNVAHSSGITLEFPGTDADGINIIFSSVSSSFPVANCVVSYSDG